MHPVPSLGRPAGGSGPRRPAVPADGHGEARPHRHPGTLAGPRNLDAGRRPAGGRRIHALGSQRRPVELRRRLRHALRRWRGCRAAARGTRCAGTPGHLVSPRCQTGANLRPPAVQQPGAEPGPPRAASPGDPPGGDGGPARLPETPRRKPPRLGGDLEGTHQAGRRRPALARASTWTSTRPPTRPPSSAPRCSGWPSGRTTTITGAT